MQYHLNNGALHNEKNFSIKVNWYIFKGSNSAVLILPSFSIGGDTIQWNFNGSNTDGWFTMAVSNSFLSP